MSHIYGGPENAPRERPEAKSGLIRIPQRVKHELLAVASDFARCVIHDRTRLKEAEEARLQQSQREVALFALPKKVLWKRPGFFQGVPSNHRAPPTESALKYRLVPS